MKRQLVIFSIMGMLIGQTLTSCSNKYLYIYSTYISSPQSHENLEYEDSLFAFKFMPEPNGIYFNIYNKTSSSAYLIWDESYIIYPDGNSYKALNTDLLISDSKISEKEKYESIIPKESNFSRFTTSTLNLSTLHEINTLYFELPASNLSNTSVDYNEFYYHFNYWPIDNKIADTYPEFLKAIEDSVFNLLKENTINNNHLGIGLTLKTGSSTITYDFRFKIREIMVYKYNQSNGSYEKYKYLNENYDFEIQDLNE
ncbi:MAG: hypothetical protein ACOYXB_06855 [Bacteroidota bacterium]